jgi:uracil phosphoribosyltransferase
MSSPSLPQNVHVSTHPCLLAKLSQLRSKSTSARETKALIHEIALIIGVEALAAGLSSIRKGTDTSPLGYEFPKDEVVPSLEEGKVSLMPILRSGLGMVDGACSDICATGA